MNNIMPGKKRFKLQKELKIYNLIKTWYLDLQRQTYSSD